MSIKILIFVLLYVADVGICKSFIIVTDTTASMSDEINVLRNHIDPVVRAPQRSGYFEDFILVPFTDPDVGTPQISSNPQDLLNFLNDVNVNGGNDCPENSLTAVEKALEISKRGSIIFLFTDAPAKDVNKLMYIQGLCQRHQSQVVTFISGECPGVPENINIYNEIAKLCSGIAFHFDIQNLQQGFKFMKQIINVEWSSINTHTEFTGRKQFSFNVNAYTKDLIIAVAGNYPDIQVTSNDGESAMVETIMGTNRALVIRVLQPLPGEYTAMICSRGQSLATFYKWNTLEFVYGFSPKKPKSLNETTKAPLPDATSYVFIELLDSNTELFLLEVRIGDQKITLELEVLDEAKKIYVAQTFFVNYPFRITIHGNDKTTHEVILGTSKLIIPQSKVTPHPIAATVEAIRSESPLVEFMSTATLYCKVKGEPKPDIWWEDDNENRLNSEDFLFELPSTYMSYATIDNATANITIHCKGKNIDEESSLSTELFVHREFIFEIIQSPSDMTIEYGTEGKLFCQVTAYPEATIQWYHNGSTVTNNENMEIVPEDNMLLIKSMSLDETGEYVCEVDNTVNKESLLAVIGISGLEAPSIEIASNEYVLKPGDSIEVECQVVKGSPKPDITWKKDINDELVDIPDGIFVEENILKISSAKSEHSGIYECIATNIQGEDSKEVTVKVHYEPIIKNNDAIIKVNVGDLVELKCDVDAQPKATVSWYLYQNEATIGIGDRQSSEDRHIHRFYARSLDSGNYCCIAENEVGRSERNITVIVLDPPFIEPFDFVFLRARVGSTLQVTCNVTLGTPVPVTRWEFISVKSITSVIIRQTTKKLDLVLRNITKANEGYYQCVAENEVAPDSVKFYLHVL